MLLAHVTERANEVRSAARGFTAEAFDRGRRAVSPRGGGRVWRSLRQRMVRRSMPCDRILPDAYRAPPLAAISVAMPTGVARCHRNVLPHGEHVAAGTEPVPPPAPAPPGPSAPTRLPQGLWRMIAPFTAGAMRRTVSLQLSSLLSFHFCCCFFC